MTALQPLIGSRILSLREQRVMIDADLADLYGVQTKVLVQAVKRNLVRFPSDFMFQLTAEEWQVLRSQSVTSNAEGRTDGRGGRRTAERERVALCRQRYQAFNGQAPHAASVGGRVTASRPSPHGGPVAGLDSMLRFSVPSTDCLRLALRQSLAEGPPRRTPAGHRVHPNR